jgi:hypothetical protein
MKINAGQARDLAQQFHDLATAVGDFRFDHWDELAKSERDRLKDMQFMLLNNSTHFITELVGVILDDVQGDLEALQKVTANAEKALENIADVKKAIEIAAELVKLGAAVASENPAAITSAVQETALVVGS